jgi:MFS family permease
MELSMTIGPLVEPPSAPPRRARWAVSLISAANGILVGTWAARIPAIQQHLGLQSGALSMALLCAAVGLLVATNVAGYLAARFGSSVVTTISGLLFCCTVPLLALAPSLPWLALALALYGATGGSWGVAMNTQGVAVEHCYGRPILASFHGFFSVGGLIGASLGGLAGGRGIAPLAHFTAISAVAAVCLVVAARQLLPAKTDAGGSSISFVLPSGALLMLGVIAFCTVLSEGAVSDWSAIYLQHTVATGAALAAGGYAAFSLLMAAGRFVGDSLTARSGARAVVRAGSLMAATGIALALLIPWAPLAIIGFGLVGAGLSSVFPIVISAAGRSSDSSSGNAIAAVATCGYVGFLAGPPSIGFLAQAAGLRAALLLIVALSLLAATLSPRVARP